MTTSNTDRLRGDTFQEVRGSVEPLSLIVLEK
jgi:hypothetical protein